MRASKPLLPNLLTSALLAASVLAAVPAAADPGAAQRGLKRTVAVDAFQTPDTIIGLQGTSEGLTSMLTHVLEHDGRYVVVERQAIAVIAAEQQLGLTGAANLETAAQGGRLIGANLIVRGAVTKFDPRAGESSVSFGGFGVSGFHAVVAVTLRAIDTTTGQVVATAKGEAIASTRGFNVDTTVANGQPLTMGNQQQTPLGQAAESAIARAVANMDAALETAPWSAQVIEAESGNVFVNAGSDQNLTAGTVLSVRRKTRELTDPSTGVVLETLMADVGRIRITEVRGRTATAQILTGAPVRGDLLRLP